MKTLKDKLLAFFAGLSALLVGYFFYRRNKEKVNGLKAAVELQKSQKKVVELRTKREAIEPQREENRREIQKLIREETEIKREMTKKLKGGEHMKPAELSKAFKEMGF